MENQKDDTFDSQTFIRDEKMQELELARKERGDLLDLAARFETHNPEFVPQIIDRIEQIQKEIEILIDKME